MWNTEHDKRPDAGKADDAKNAPERPVAEGDLIGNFVRRTDNDFHGRKEEGLIGKDIGDDEDEEGDETAR
jgi:hypothetical protein